MTEALYPYGYKVDASGVAGMGTMITMAQMEAKKTVYMLHPEFWRRYRALMEAAVESGMHLGVGTGWRVQPNPPPPGFAAPGNSNHEGFPADAVSGGAIAIDTVVAPSWGWMEKNLKLYGLRSFLYPSTSGYKGKNEPWHIQPAECPASRMWRTQPWKLNTFPLPPTGTTPPPTPVPQPPPSNWAMDLMAKMPEIVRGMRGRYVMRVQHFLALAGEFDATNMSNFDGIFGSGTESAVKRFQISHKQADDGRVGTKEWELFCAAGDGIANLQVGSYGLDVQRMQRMLSANDFMDPANQANFDGQFGSGTQTALKKFQQAKLLTVDGKCGQKTWTALLYG